MYTIRFGTDGWRAVIAREFTFAHLTRLAEGVAQWMKQQYSEPAIMLGYDTRFMGEVFARHAANVLAQQGVQVFLGHRFVSSPMVALAAFKRQTQMGMMLTASHNPAWYGGVKLKTGYGGPLPPAIAAEIEALIPDEAGRYTDQFDALAEDERIHYYDMEALYLNHLREIIDFRAIRRRDLRVAYDALYGAGQRVIPKVLPGTVMLHARVDPNFGGITPDPQESRLSELQQTVTAEGLDLGLATDGDADRLGVIDEKGHFLDTNHVSLLLAQYLIEHKNLKGALISTIACSERLQRLADHYGLEVVRTPVGFKYIGEQMNGGTVLVGAEATGGIALAGHIPDRDGLFAGLSLLEYMAVSGRKLADLRESLYRITGPFACRQQDMPMPLQPQKAILAGLAKGHFTRFGGQEVVESDTRDGFKLYLRADKTQSLLVRSSGTEEVLRIYAEADTAQAADAILEDAHEQLRTYLNQHHHA